MPDKDYTLPFKLALKAQTSTSNALQQKRMHNNAALVFSHDILEHASDMRAGSPTQLKGHKAEATALFFLKKKGLLLLRKNLYCKFGELELVMQDHHSLVFIEERWRKANSMVNSVTSVQNSKQQRLRLCARYFLPHIMRVHFNGVMPICRFDVVAIDGKQIQWIQNAFYI